MHPSNFFFFEQKQKQKQKETNVCLGSVSIGVFPEITRSRDRPEPARLARLGGPLGRSTCLRLFISGLAGLPGASQWLDGRWGPARRCLIAVAVHFAGCDSCYLLSQLGREVRLRGAAAALCSIGTLATELLFYLGTSYCHGTHSPTTRSHHTHTPTTPPSPHQNPLYPHTHTAGRTGGEGRRDGAWGLRRRVCRGR